MWWNPGVGTEKQSEPKIISPKLEAKLQSLSSSNDPREEPGRSEETSKLLQGSGSCQGSGLSNRE